MHVCSSHEPISKKKMNPAASSGAYQSGPYYHFNLIFRRDSAIFFNDEGNIYFDIKSSAIPARCNAVIH